MVFVNYWKVSHFSSWRYLLETKKESDIFLNQQVHYLLQYIFGKSSLERVAFQATWNCKRLAGFEAEMRQYTGTLWLKWDPYLRPIFQRTTPVIFVIKAVCFYRNVNLSFKNRVRTSCFSSFKDQKILIEYYPRAKHCTTRTRDKK